MRIWILIASHDSGFQTDKEPFSIEVGPSEDVEQIKIKVLDKSPNILFNVDIAQLSVWKTDGKFALFESKEHYWKEVLKKVDIKDEEAVKKVLGTQLVADLGLLDNQILLLCYKFSQVATPDNALEAKDKVPDLREFKRYQRALATLGSAPSGGARSSGYHISQGAVDQTIYDGRTPRHGNGIFTIAPPIQIFHTIFDEFTHLLNSPDVQPTIEDLEKVYKFMHTLSLIRTAEEKYGEIVRASISEVLGETVLEVPNPDGSRPDGVIMINDNTDIPCVVIEMKREMGEGGCDPTSQAALSMRRSWIHNSRAFIREQCCCPTFLIGAGGPWFSILAGVFTDKVIVQRLTELRWMAVSSTEEDNRVYHNARVLIALRECVKRLKEFYRDINLHYTAFRPNEPHPHYFPYPTLFTDETGTMTHFRYLGSLEDHPTCVTYLAEITEENSTTVCPHVKVVVKFVSSYGKEVHQYLARKGWAPNLRYCGPFQTRLQDPDDIPRSTQSALAGLRLNAMRMVVMDYIDARLEPPLNARGQVKEVLKRLHADGYVFGDLREPNILFDTDGMVKFVDFDWSGRYDMKIRDEGSADVRQEQIENMDRVQVGDGPYVYYPLGMSRIVGMWAPGMNPLTQIRPKHDWMMFDKLSW